MLLNALITGRALILPPAWPGPKNLVEAIEMQAAYWRKQFGELRMQAEEVRVLLEKVTDSVTEPIKAQVTLDRMPRSTLRA